MKNVPLVTAHRGAKGLVKYENTLDSFKKAIEVEADAIEFDVRRSSDGIMFVHHDDHIQQTILANLTYQQIVELAHKIGYHPPTLVEVLTLLKGQIFFDIELKETGYEILFTEEILKHLSYQEFYIRTFEDSSIKIIKKHDRQIKVGLLLGVETPKHGLFTRLSELFPCWRIMKTKADFVSPYYRLVKLAYVKRMHLIKKPVYVWTVNNEEMMKKLLKKKVDGLVTDYPDLARSLIKKATE